MFRFRHHLFLDCFFDMSKTNIILRWSSCYRCSARILELSSRLCYCYRLWCYEHLVRERGKGSVESCCKIPAIRQPKIGRSGSRSPHLNNLPHRIPVRFLPPSEKTRMEHDAMRHVVGVTDALGRRTQFDWCPCGALEGIVDAKLQPTTFVGMGSGDIS